MHFEFVVHITEDTLGRKKLPDKFTEFLADQEPGPVNLREGSYGECRRSVEVFFHRKIKIYLDAGFEKFARVHSLEVRHACCYAAMKAMAT
jgi:hypothetical protein